MSTIPSSEFIRVAPLAQARRYADMELHGAARPDQIRWLHEHPLLWLRALTGIKRDVESHIGNDRMSVSGMKPAPGGNPTAWLAVKAELDGRTLRRQHFLIRVRARLDEVCSLLGSEPAAGHWLIGEVVAVLTNIEAALEDDDVRAATDIAHHHAKRWAAQLREDRGR